MHAKLPVLQYVGEVAVANVRGVDGTHQRLQLPSAQHICSKPIICSELAGKNARSEIFLNCIDVSYYLRQNA